MYVLTLPLSKTITYEVDSSIDIKRIEACMTSPLPNLPYSFLPLPSYLTWPIPVFPYFSPSLSHTFPPLPVWITYFIPLHQSLHILPVPCLASHSSHLPFIIPAHLFLSIPIPYLPHTILFFPFCLPSISNTCPPMSYCLHTLPVMYSTFPPILLPFPIPSHLFLLPYRRHPFLPMTSNPTCFIPSTHFTSSSLPVDSHLVRKLQKTH